MCDRWGSQPGREAASEMLHLRVSLKEHPKAESIPPWSSGFFRISNFVSLANLKWRGCSQRKCSLSLKNSSFCKFFYCFKKQSVLLGAVHASNSFELELIIYVQQWTVSNFHEFWTKSLGPRLTFKGRPIESFGWTSITAKLLATSRLWQMFDIHWS